MKGTEPMARVVLVTAPSSEVAESLVRQVVEERVVACGNILPGFGQEFLLLVKIVAHDMTVVLGMELYPPCTGTDAERMVCFKIILSQ